MQIGFGAVVVCVAALWAVSARGALRVQGLRCEALTAPVAVAEVRPRLGWRLVSADRDEIQTAYQVRVASTRDGLASDAPDLWDSTRVESGEHVNVFYEGKPLRPGRAVWWQVRAWDRAGQPSDWSEPATFGVGLLAEADWSARWVGHAAPASNEAPFAMTGAQWIRHASDAEGVVPKGYRRFTASFDLPDGAEVASAVFGVTAVDRFHLYLNNRAAAVNHPAGGESVVVGEAREFLRSGANRIHLDVGRISATNLAAVFRLVVTLADGRVVESVSDGTWTSAADNGDTKPAPVAVAGAFGDALWKKTKVEQLVLPPAVRLRGTFAVTSPVTRAVLHATALGVADFFLNGKRVTEDRFSPGWTDYAKRVQSRAWDVTSLVTSGTNVLAAELATGWFAGHVGWGHQHHLWGKHPRVRAQLVLEHADGTVTTAGTDESWRSAESPTRQADMLAGEVYDARCETPGWNTAAASVSAWTPVVTGSDEVKPVVEPSPMPPVRVIQEFPAQAVTQPRPGVFVFDFGQNVAGVCRLRINGKAGQRLILRYAERLNLDGTVYTENLRGAWVTDTYICRGGGEEVWEPRFTFHGFQYVEVLGWDGAPGVNALTLLALGTDTPRTGDFTCSNPMLNKLVRNIYWTQRANFLEAPTDCPQRDERLGWTGDAQTFVRAATYNADVQSFFTKWLRDLADIQRADGAIHSFAPWHAFKMEGGPAWSDAMVICPIEIQHAYDDKRLLERLLPAMTNFVRYLERSCGPGLAAPEKFPCYGDWLSINADTPKPLIYQAYFAQSAKLVAQACDTLGRKEEAESFRDLARRAREAFVRDRVKPDGRIDGDTQTAYVLAIMFDLVEGDAFRKAGEYLAANVEKRGTLSTGFVGTKDLMPALTKSGRSDLAYRLLESELFPGWGFSVKHGATTIWERWNGWTPDGGPHPDRMNSYSHYSFGAVYQWMVENIGGLRAIEPGWNTFEVAPAPGGTLSNAAVKVGTVHGDITSSWRRGGAVSTFEVTVPVGTVAKVRLPVREGLALSEGTAPAAVGNGIRSLKREPTQVLMELGSGTYKFEAK